MADIFVSNKKLSIILFFNLSENTYYLIVRTNLCFNKVFIFAALNCFLIVYFKTLYKFRRKIYYE